MQVLGDAEHAYRSLESGAQASFLTRSIVEGRGTLVQPRKKETWPLHSSVEHNSKKKAKKTSYKSPKRSA